MMQVSEGCGSCLDTVWGRDFCIDNWTVGGGGSDTSVFVNVCANGGEGVETISVDVEIGSQTFDCTRL